MKTFLRTLLLLTACITANGCTASPSPELYRRSVVSLSRPLSGYFCTGVAVGPHTVLTNAHCLRDEQVVLYNGKACLSDKVVAFDGVENVLVHTCQTFKHWSRISHREYKVGTKAIHYGHPYGLNLMYREGMLVMVGDGVDFHMPAGKVYIWDMNATNGDSGGPLWDRWGRVICTVSFGIHMPGDGFQVTACYPPAFTKAQLKEIK